MMIESRILFAESVPKDGLTSEQCEDQFAISATARVFAVSDGATHSLYARLWAQCLVEHFHVSPTSKITNDWLRPAMATFFGSIDHSRLPWHALAKLAEGAFATLAGIVVDEEQPVLDGVIVGDSCVLVFSPGIEPKFFPPLQAEDFRLDPNLLSSIEARNTQSVSSACRIGPLELPYGQTFVVVMTDAMAYWYLSTASALGTEEALDRFFCLERKQDFEQIVRNARLHEGMKNDDCTLVIVELYRG